MIYTFVGGPGEKEDLAQKLKDFLNEGNCENDCYIIVDDIVDAGGFLVDYRSELLWAATRACNPAGKDQNVIFTHSLLDSLAYAGVKTQALLEHDTESPEAVRWLNVFNCILQMAIDGFKSDRILYVPYEGDDDKLQLLEEAFLDIFNALGIEYTEIDPKGEVTTWTSN